MPATFSSSGRVSVLLAVARPIGERRDEARQRAVAVGLHQLALRRGMRPSRCSTAR